MIKNCKHGRQNKWFKKKEEGGFAGKRYLKKGHQGDPLGKGPSFQEEGFEENWLKKRPMILLIDFKFVILLDDFIVLILLILTIDYLVPGRIHLFGTPADFTG